MMDMVLSFGRQENSKLFAWWYLKSTLIRCPLLSAVLASDLSGRFWELTFDVFFKGKISTCLMTSMLDYCLKYSHSQCPTKTKFTSEKRQSSLCLCRHSDLYLLIEWLMPRSKIQRTSLRRKQLALCLHLCNLKLLFALLQTLGKVATVYQPC